MVKVGRYRRVANRMRRKRLARIKRSIRGAVKRQRTSNVRFKKSASLGKGFPSKLIMTHRYVTNYPDQIVGGSAPAVISIRANGMYDPEVALGGHQPLNFDQMCAVYNHWTVIGSRIKWTLTQTEGDLNAHLYATTYLNDDANLSAASIYALAEQNGTRTHSFPAGQYSPQPKRFFQKFSARRQFGKGSLNNSLTRGSVSSDPTEQSIFQLVMQGAPGSPDIRVDVLIEVEYIAVWNEPKEIPQS